MDMTNMKKLALLIALMLIPTLIYFTYIFKASENTPEVGIIQNVNIPTTTPTIVEDLKQKPEPIIDELRSVASIPLNKTEFLMGIYITPTSVVIDSRCPINVNCIWAGSVVVRATIKMNATSSVKDFILGEPVEMGDNIITLIEVSPHPISGKSIKSSDYKLTFKSIKTSIKYKNASSDMINITSPTSESVVGKEFSVIGEARGQFFFESNARIRILDKDGKIIFSGMVKASENSMTTEFVSFVATVKIPDSYVGKATIILLNDNPSGLEENESTVSFPINIEY